jgi:hypothetical protein
MSDDTGWFPTMELRFEERIEIRFGDICTAKILQQKWEWRTDQWFNPNPPEAEWRDIPCVTASQSTGCADATK